MKSRPSRVSFTVLATFLFLIAALPTSSLPSSSRGGRKAPDADQLALADWAAGRTSDLSVMRPQDLQAALVPQPQGFNLFRQQPDLLGERSFLAKLPYGHAIWRAAVRNRMDGLLLAAVVETESAFSSKAVSPEGAIGLMQVIPETGELYGKADLFDPNVNLDVGCQYLAGLIERYHGDLRLAVAAYNAGPAAVARYRGVPPYRETRDYVESVLGLYANHRESVRKETARSDGGLLARTAAATPSAGGGGAGGSDAAGRGLFGSAPVTLASAVR
jgi:soluble lytic murein transglycosylase-like protein